MVSSDNQNVLKMRAYLAEKLVKDTHGDIVWIDVFKNVSTKQKDICFFLLDGVKNPMQKDVTLSGQQTMPFQNLPKMKIPHLNDSHS